MFINLRNDLSIRGFTIKMIVFIRLIVWNISLCFDHITDI